MKENRMASYMTNEESFRNACHNATLTYEQWERVKPEYKAEYLHDLLNEAQEVQAAAWRLLKAHGWVI